MNQANCSVSAKALRYNPSTAPSNKSPIHLARRPHAVLAALVVDAGLTYQGPIRRRLAGAEVPLASQFFTASYGVVLALHTLKTTYGVLAHSGDQRHANNVACLVPSGPDLQLQNLPTVCVCLTNLEDRHGRLNKKKLIMIDSQRRKEEKDTKRKGGKKMFPVGESNPGLRRV